MWVIQRWTDGQWENYRHENGLPMMYPRKCEAQIQLRSIIRRGKYRIVLVRD